MTLIVWILTSIKLSSTTTFRVCSKEERKYLFGQICSCHDFVSKTCSKATLIIEWIFIKYFCLVKNSQPPEACKCQLISDAPKLSNTILHRNLPSPGTPLLLLARVLHISWEGSDGGPVLDYFYPFIRLLERVLFLWPYPGLQQLIKREKNPAHKSGDARVSKSLSSSLLTFSMLSFIYPEMGFLSKNKKYGTNTRMPCVTKT